MTIEKLNALLGAVLSLLLSFTSIRNRYEPLSGDAKRLVVAGVLGLRAVIVTSSRHRPLLSLRRGNRSAAAARHRLLKALSARSSSSDTRRFQSPSFRRANLTSLSK